MFNITGRKVASKWAKTKVLLADERAAKHIPETQKFTADNLKNMLEKYDLVFVKPVVGSGGYGVTRIKKEDGQYKYKYYRKTKYFTTIDALVKEINKRNKKRKLMIQQGIKLATIKGRPIDYRFKIQKPKKKWIITGMVGRLARKGYYVTNLCKGGTRLTFTQGIKRSLPEANVKQLKKEMRSLTRHCTKLLEKEFPGIRKLGFDYGVDKSGNFWIFEVNTNPS